MATSRSKNEFHDLQFSLQSKAALAKINLWRGTSYSCLKPKQAMCLKEALNSDTMAILPTGFGKSLIFEMLPLLSSDEAAVVICTPLNSIIEEQMQRYGERAARVDGELIKALKDGNGEPFKEGKFTYIIGHPEQLTEKEVCDVFTTKVWEKKVTHVVIDEAHCVLNWGKDFRPSFQQLPKLRAVFSSAFILALTATATLTTRKEISSALQMNNVHYITANIDRPNIKLSVKRSLPRILAEESFEGVVLPIVNELATKRDAFPKTIVYSKLKQCGAGYESCLRVEPSTKSLVSQFHAACTEEMKHKIVEAMATTDSELKLLFATEAYSMGTDAPDVRRVIHISPPTTLETYLQEVGRAGRDGKRSGAILHFNNSDLATNVKGMTDSMRKYCRLASCRRDYLCQHFGFELLQDTSNRRKHDCCDVCENACNCDDCLCEEAAPVVTAANDIGMTDPEDFLPLANVLFQYFREENRIAPGSVFTGLTFALAKEIAKSDIVDIDVTAEELKMKYPLLNDVYTGTIASIIKEFIRQEEMQMCTSEDFMS